MILPISDPASLDEEEVMRPRPGKLALLSILALACCPGVAEAGRGGFGGGFRGGGFSGGFRGGSFGGGSCGGYRGGSFGGGYGGYRGGSFEGYRGGGGYGMSSFNRTPSFGGMSRSFDDFGGMRGANPYAGGGV